MAKKRKGKKGKGPRQPDVRKQSLEELLAEGKAHLDNGRAREAIQLFKQAAKKSEAPETLHPLLFDAYVARRDQLRQKGLIQEANAIHELAEAVRPPLTDMTEADLGRYFQGASPKRIIAGYETWLKERPPSPGIEAQLAGRLLAGDGWEDLAGLPAELPICRNAPIAREAAALMNVARWEEALELLRPVSRSSPFAPWRLFCRGMAAFYQGNDTDAMRALSMVPADFPLHPVARDLKALLEQPPEEREPRPTRAACLWEGAVGLKQETAGFLSLLKDRLSPKPFQAAVERLSHLAAPAAPQAAKRFILEVAAETLMHRDDIDAASRALEGALPFPDIQMILYKTIWNTGILPLSSAKAYIHLMEREFPDPGEKEIARAQILLQTAIHLQNRGPFDPEPEERMHPDPVLGIRTSDWHTGLAEMVLESIRLDPRNRQAYEVLAGLPRPERPVKDLVEKGLQAMREAFPADPYPCLQLADLYYEKNAYRKAETILGTALSLAPHDQRVLEKYAASLLAAAHRNLRAGRLALAGRDLRWAAETGSRQAQTAVTAKQIILAMAGEGRPLVDALNAMETALPLPDRLRVYALVSMDNEQYRSLLKQSPHRWEFMARYNRALQQIGTLAPPEIMRLLAPLPIDVARVFSPGDMAAEFLGRTDKNLLKPLENGDVLLLYPQILTTDAALPIIRDLARRLRAKHTPERLQLEFLHLAVEHLFFKGRKPERFHQVVAKADDREKDRLKELSRRLVPLAQGPLQAALSRFDFTILTDRAGFGPEGWPDPGELGRMVESIMEGVELEIPDEFDEDAFFDTLDFLVKNPEEIDEDDQDILLEDLQEFLATYDLIGLSPRKIRSFRDIWMKTPRLRQRLEMLQKFFAPKRFPDLPKEAQLFIFGKMIKA